MADLDRERVLACLQALGAEDDQAVLATARDLHAQITQAGAHWQDLLIPEDAEEGPDTVEEGPDTVEDDPDTVEDDPDTVEDDPGDAEDDPNDTEDDPEDAAAAALSSQPAAKNDDDLAIVKALLGRSNLYEGTRNELEEYRQDIKSGEFTGEDRKYLRALAARLKN